MPEQEPLTGLTALIPRLRRYARALTGDRHAADDLVQDTCTRALEKRGLWRGGKLDVWLLCIMHNLFVSGVRRPRPMLSLDDIPEQAQRPTQADRLELAEVHRALATLPVEQRQVLLLVSLDERSYQEVAEILDIPLGTVMSRLSRGRQRLQQSLESPRPPVLKLVK